MQCEQKYNIVLKRENVNIHLYVDIVSLGAVR